MINYNTDNSIEKVLLTSNFVNQIEPITRHIQFPYADSKHMNITISRNEFTSKLLAAISKTNLLHKSSVVEGSYMTLIYNADENFYAQLTFNCGKRTDYYTFDFYVISNEIKNMQYIFEILSEIESQHSLPFKTFNIKWHFNTRNGIDYAFFEEPIQEAVNPLAYPYIDQGIVEYIDRYLASKESVLILIGSAGVGKTTLIRYIIGRHNELSQLKSMSNRQAEKESSTIFYTSDASVLEADDMFINFATSESSIMVLEDIDLHLTSRSSGNVFMYKLLSASDGLIKNLNRKIIISTNLPNMTEIDDALVRKGRCFGVMEFRPLNIDEALNFLKSMDELKYNILADLKSVRDFSRTTFSLAELYSDEFFVELQNGK